METAVRARRTGVKKRHAIGVRIDLYDRLTQLAKLRGVGRSTLIEQWIAEALDKKDADAERERQKTS